MLSGQIKHLPDQCKAWFIDYASYVVLHRAVTHIDDGLKPSQRRVLHSLWELEDGRYNKVATVVGNTLKYHPHGDASVFETLVAIGQKGLLVDMQGNWGNILTGDGPAAQRYIEARLTPFAKEIVFSPKATTWTKSYDGRNDEPVTLPIKFPLLLAQGTEGIAVSLACKILPHNFNELCDAAIAHLLNRPFILYPDFPTGGEIDVSDYNDGAKGSKIKVRAKIIPVNKHDLEIVEIPFGTTTATLLDSIVKAENKGKIKIKRVDDMTGEKVSLIIELAPGTDQETAIQALYAFTECEVAHHPNTIVIKESRPHPMTISQILAENVKRTLEILKLELQIRLGELDARWHKISLERLFIKTRTYLELEQATSHTIGIARITNALAPHIHNLRQPPVHEDYEHLTTIPIRRISLYDEASAERELETLEKEERALHYKLNHLTETAVQHFTEIKRKYGADKIRKTHINLHGFAKIQIGQVALTNQKVYWDAAAGFVGTSLRKNDPLPFEINEHSDIVGLNRQGILKVLRPGEKSFYAEDLLDIRPTGTNEDAPVYNLIYEDHETKTTYAKRFQILSGFIRDKTYLVAGGNEKNKVLYLHIQPTPSTPHPNITITLDSKAPARIKSFYFDFTQQEIKNRDAKGNTVTKYKVRTIR